MKGEGKPRGMRPAGEAQTAAQALHAKEEEWQAAQQAADLRITDLQASTVALQQSGLCLLPRWPLPMSLIISSRAVQKGQVVINKKKPVKDHPQTNGLANS